MVISDWKNLWEQATNIEQLERKWNKNIRKVLELGDRSYYSHVQENWEQFTFNGGNPLIITSVDENTNTATIVQSSLPTQKPITIIWENNWPKIIRNNKWNEYLFWAEIWEWKIKESYLINDNLTAFEKKNFPYPVKFIEIDWNAQNILIEENNDFIRVLNLDNTLPFIYFKKADKYIQVKVEDLLSISPWFRWLPKIDWMSAYWDKLVYWDKEKEIFIYVKFNDKILRWVSRESNVFSINKEGGNEWEKGWTIEYFTPSREDPKKPASVEINGVHMLACEEENNESWKKVIETKISINWQELKINLDEYYEVNWYKFYRTTTILWKTRYTDWKELFNFGDKKNYVATYNYKWVNYPIIKGNVDKFINKEDDTALSIAYVQDWKVEVIYLIENIKLQKKSGWEPWENEKITTNIKLIFNEEQENLVISNIYPRYWIVCLAPNDLNKSKYRFYRINQDWTLILMFINKSNIEIDNYVIIKNDKKRYKLILRPNTTSIFDTIIINWEECLLAEWENEWEVKYIRIIDHNKIEELDLDINPKTSKPKNSFEFEWETLYYNNNWKIKICGIDCLLSDKFWKMTNEPKKAIFQTWNIPILLVLIPNKSPHIYWYSPILNNKSELKNLDHNINVEGVFKRAGKREVILFTFDWKKYICKSDDDITKTLWIYEVKDDRLSLRYIQKIDNEEKPELKWEEFTCMSEIIIIDEIISSEYLRWKDGNIYYRKKLWKNLEKVYLPEWVRFNKYPSVGTSNDKSYRLYINGWKLVSISEELYYLYLLDESNIAIILNWEKKLVTNFWDSRSNRIVTYEKVWDNYIPLKLWNLESKFRIENGSIIIYGVNSREIQIDTNPNNEINIVHFWNKENEEFGILLQMEKWQTDNRFRRILNTSDWLRKICSMYEVNWNIVVVDLSKKWHKVRLTLEWQIIIDEIDYWEEIIDQIYEDNRPEEKTVEWTIEETWDKVQWIVDEK